MGELTKLLTNFFGMIHDGILSLGITDQGLGYILAIVVYTLILKTIILPLFIYQQKSVRSTTELSPRLKELQAKYKNNPQKMQEEQMKLYKELGVNPFKGCLPLLVQLPIFMAMFSVLSSYQGFNGVSFLWIKDLAKPDNLYILPVLTAVVQYLSIKISSRNMDEEQKKMQKRTGLMMSVIFLFFCINYKAVLAVYFIASSIIQVFQTLIVTGYLDKRANEEKEVKAAKESERLEREAKEKAARREEYKKKKKKRRMEQNSNPNSNKNPKDKTGN